VDPIIKKPG